MIAKIEKYHGEPAIMVNGEPFPPMTITVSMDKLILNSDQEGKKEELKEYLHNLRTSGIRIFYVEAETKWTKPGDKEKGILDGISATKKVMEFLLSSVPDAYVMLRLDVSPSAEWVNTHPEDQILFSDGKHHPTICTSVSRNPIDGMYSFCSENWKYDAIKYLDEYFEEVEKEAFFSHVIGFFLCAGGTSEWYYPEEQATDKQTYSGYSEPFRKFYSHYLREKYKTEERLRKAWKISDASFSNPVIPNVSDRKYIKDADKDIDRALMLWERAGRFPDIKINIDGREDVNIGVLLDANKNIKTADFYNALSEGTAEAVVYFASYMKARFPALLVGAFYGSLGCQDYYEYGTSTGTLTVLDSGKVDFLAAPGTYNNREPGGVVAQREMQDSLRLRNQIYICEDDARTHNNSFWLSRIPFRLYSSEDSVNTLKRDFARDLCEEVNAWWFDMGCGWYNTPEILSLFSRQQEIAKKDYELDRTKKNEIALIYDTQSVHYASDQTDRQIFDFFRTSDIHRIGAPVDYYFHDDMARAEMPDYKLYIMMNQYYLTEAELEAIYNKVRKNHATIVWLYAAGLYNPDDDNIMDMNHCDKTTNMKVKMIDKTMFPDYKIEKIDHPITNNLSHTQHYGFIDRDVHSNVWIGKPIRAEENDTPLAQLSDSVSRWTMLPTAYVNPGFYVEDESVLVLGRYCCNGLPALALKECDECNIVYCGTVVLRNDLIASIAKYAGCHIYSDSDDVLYANENFIALHASSDGVKHISFKKKCNPYEVYEKKYYGIETNELSVEMKLGETKMWCVNSAFTD